MKRYPLPFMTLVLLGCATPVDRQDNPVTSPTSLAAGEVRELCFAATAGDQVHYRFEASAPLQFNLHYHHAGETYYPVPTGLTSASKGTYQVPATRNYCLLWRNMTGQAVALELTLSGAAIINDGHPTQ